jgi:hypothetical protein
MTGDRDGNNHMDNTITGVTERQAFGHSALITLVLIPLIIIVIWLLEDYLLAGTTHLFRQGSLPVLVLYTILSCILVGIIVPILRIRAAFLSGAVNMFQIGFRTARRTVAAVILTSLAVYAFFIVTGLNGSDRIEGAGLFMLLLPSAISAVMLCWVLAGTHVQAYVRSDGVMVSVIAGVLVTALIFALAMSILFAGGDFPKMFAGFFVAGCIAAFFFFAVRDIYATAIVVTSSLIVLLNAYIDPVYLNPINPVVMCCGIAATVVLVSVHWHFSRHYTTVMLPEK